MGCVDAGGWTAVCAYMCDPVLRARTADCARARGAVLRRPRPAAGETPLGLLLQSPACEASVPLLEGLVERGADANMVTEGMTPLAQASAQPPPGMHARLRAQPLGGP